jgi:hypothetical protein
VISKVRKTAKRAEGGCKVQEGVANVPMLKDCREMCTVLKHRLPELYTHSVTVIVAMG